MHTETNAILFGIFKSSFSVTKKSGSNNATYYRRCPTVRKEAVAFVPVLAELGGKYKQFEDHQRVGLFNEYVKK
jgi:hypothetical protein